MLSEQEQECDTTTWSWQDSIVFKIPKMRQMCNKKPLLVISITENVFLNSS